MLADTCGAQRRIRCTDCCERTTTIYELLIPCVCCSCTRDHTRLDGVMRSSSLLNSHTDMCSWLCVFVCVRFCGGDKMRHRHRQQLTHNAPAAERLFACLGVADDADRGTHGSASTHFTAGIMCQQHSEHIAQTGGHAHTHTHTRTNEIAQAQAIVEMWVRRRYVGNVCPSMPGFHSRPIL